MRSLGRLSAVSLLLLGVPAAALPPGNGHPGSSPGDVWRARASMPTARNAFAAAAINGKIYVVGGIGDGVLDLVEEYDPRTDSWRQRSPMPTPRFSLAVIATGGRLYAIGGQNGQDTLDTVEVYDPRTDSWASVDSLPVASSRLAAVVVKGKIYAIGGFTRSSGSPEIIGTVQRYDPKAGVWDLLSEMPTPRSSYAIGTIGRHIYVMYGASPESPGGGGPFDLYDWVADSWAPTVRLNTDFIGPAGAVLRRKMYVIGGGHAQASVTVTNNLEYDPATGTFSTRAPMPTHRMDAAAVTLGGEIYVLGGRQLPSGITVAVEAYTPPRAGCGDSDGEIGREHCGSVMRR